MSTAKVNTFDWFKTTYKWMVKTYPQTERLFHRDSFTSEILGKLSTQKYTKSGGRWVLTESTTEDFTAYNYCNSVDAIPFFRGMGGKERAQMGYTKHGYIPLQLSSVSPDGQSKTVRSFIFR